MRLIQLYIEGKRIDLFKDEVVSVTQSIQNVKDIERVFTSFSKTFTVPASKNNNKVFKHYYKWDIVDGYDARLKRNAQIEINDILFQKGKIKLEGVDMRDKQPYAYRITFFGNTVELKDLVGDDKLNNLDTLTQYNLNYTEGNIKSKLQNTIGDVCVPLITHTQRLFYDSVAHTNGDGNLYYHTGGGNNLHGVAWNQLKYALRVNKIIEAIEDRYTIANGYSTDLTFSSDFFKDTSNDTFNNLFMWMHRKSGDVENLGGNLENQTLVEGWSNATSNSWEMTSDTLYFIPLIGGEYIHQALDIEFTTTSTDSYSIQIERNASIVAGLPAGTGTRTLSVPFSGSQNLQFFRVFVTSSQQIDFTGIEWQVSYYYTPPNNPQAPPTFFTFTPNSGAFSSSTLFNFDFTLQIPDIKVLDFLTGLFKMFNLTAYVDEDNSTETSTVIKVQPLDEYYATFNTYDISDYVVKDQGTVNAALPFRQITFSYKDTKTFLANRFRQLANREWGAIDYSTFEQELAGPLYRVELPFSHFQYERLVDNPTVTTTPIQWGWSVNESQNAYKGDPLLFYPVRVQSYPTAISFVDDIDPNTGDFLDHTLVYNYIVPSNSVALDSTTDNSNINFEEELNEYTGNSFGGTLFLDYYSTYIANVFNPKSRLVKVTAFLPIGITLKLQLNDQLLINGVRFKINSIDTNLMTGESKMELLNVI